MSSEIIQISPGLLALIQGKSQALMPFVRELIMLECHIAGTSHLNLEETEPTLKPGDRFILKREPENQFDHFATAIYTADKIKLGYLPMHINESTARLLGAGKQLFGALETKEWKGQWLKLNIKVYLIDR